MQHRRKKIAFLLIGRSGEEPALRLALFAVYCSGNGLCGRLVVKREGKNRGTVALAIGLVGVSSSAVLNKGAVAAGMHPVWLNAMRLGLTVLILLPFFLRSRSARQAVMGLPKKERNLTLLSGAMLAVHFAAWTGALVYADALVVTTVWSTYSLMTVLGASLVLHERTPVPALLGIVLAIVGVGICALGARGVQLTGVVLALLAAASQAVYTLCGRTVRRTLDTLPYTMLVYTVACGCMLLCALFFRIPATGMGWQGVGASVALAVICTLGGHSMQNYALRYLKAPTVSAVMLLEVLTGPLLVFLVFGETPRPAGIIGGAVILAGVAWYMHYEWRKANESVRGDGKKAQHTRV